MTCTRCSYPSPILVEPALVMRCACGGCIDAEDWVEDHAEKLTVQLESAVAREEVQPVAYDSRLEPLRGRLIVFEGQDQTGKTTVSTLLASLLRQSGIPTTWTFQPGDLAYGEHASTLRSLAKDAKYGLDPLANYFVFLADKVEVTKKIVQPALARGESVISDRWHYSTVAYQEEGRKLKEEISGLTRRELGLISVSGLEPDFVFYFPERIEACRPKEDMVQRDQWETAGDEFAARVRASYEDQATRLEWIRVQPGDSPVATLENLIESIPKK